MLTDLTSQNLWRQPKPCWRAWLPLDLPPSAAVAYRASNYFVPLAPGGALFSPSAFAGEYYSETVIVAGDEKSSTYVLAGALTARRSLTSFMLVKRGRLSGIEVKQPEIPPDGEPEELLVLTGDDWRRLLIEYAERAAAAMGRPIRSFSRNIVGYSSWYYYYANVTEENVLENLRALSRPENREAFSADYLQIDDGYQLHQGDWLSRRACWPSPLEKTASAIRGGGFQPGIWLMPFLASTASGVYRRHPDWFVKAVDRDEPLVFSGWSPPPDHLWACLDPTIPAVRRHLAEVFKRLYQKGFTFFKLDGLGFSLPEGRRHDPDATSVSAYRLGLETIRRAVPDAVILGCGAPFLPSVGLIDHCRVSNDTGREWALPRNFPNSDGNPMPPGIGNALHGTLANWWMFDRWFRADPDAVMARQDNASYTVGEARLSVLAAILTGVAVTSDRLETIAPERRGLLTAAARYRLLDPVPEFWECDSHPQIFTGTCGGRRAAAILNDAPEEMRYDLSRIFPSGNCREILQGLGELSGTLTLPPHDGVLLVEKV